MADRICGHSSIYNPNIHTIIGGPYNTLEDCEGPCLCGTCADWDGLGSFDITNYCPGTSPTAQFTFDPQTCSYSATKYLYGGASNGSVTLSASCDPDIEDGSRWTGSISTTCVGGSVSLGQIITPGTASYPPFWEIIFNPGECGCSETTTTSTTTTTPTTTTLPPCTVDVIFANSNINAYYLKLVTDCPNSWLNNVVIPLTTIIEGPITNGFYKYYLGNIGNTESCETAWVAMKANETEVDLFSISAQLNTISNQGGSLTNYIHWVRRNISTNDPIDSGTYQRSSYRTYSGGPWQLCFNINKTRFDANINVTSAGLNNYAMGGCPPNGNYICGGTITENCKEYYGLNAGDYGITLTDDDICPAELQFTYRVYQQLSSTPF